MKRVGLFVCCLLVSSAAQGQFFRNLERLRGDLQDDKAQEFLDTIELNCSDLQPENDRTYQRTLGGAQPESDTWQSPFSAQSRMCATIIGQFDPELNPYHIAMRSCEKFRAGSPIRECCLGLRQGFSVPETKSLVLGLCQDVPDHFALINGQKARHDMRCRQDASCYQLARKAILRLFKGAE